MKRKITAVLLALLLLFSLSGCAPKELAEYDRKNPPIGGMLSVQDGQITTPDGEEILLCGINLGGWMLMETWMGPIVQYAEDWGYYDTLEVLESRFGAEKTAELIKTYEDHFITAGDIAQIERLGFNCVRVPFWYRNFMTEDGAWLSENPDENPGFLRLDWLLDQCEQHGIYVILDLHGAPGGQSMNHCTGKAGRNLLYTEESNLETAERLWQAIAERYRDNPVIAAYDLLNEPQNNGGYTGDTAWAAESAEAVSHTNAAYDCLYHAVRAVDSGHIISLEGIWSTTVLPDPNEMGYENMLYQLHLYDTDRGMVKYRVQELTAARQDWGTAVLVGEFNNQKQERYACEQYRKNQIGCIKWTYKTVNTGDNWGLFNGSIQRIDIKTASYEEIYDCFENSLHTADFTFNAQEMADISP
ncbi:MAG: glycoside hydrolase family 5 protein [Hominenteromicrobium sp.]